MNEEQLKKFWGLIQDLDIHSNDLENFFDQLTEVEEKFQSFYCEISGEHEFIMDMCGYWQYQFCLRCRKPKYPDLAKKSCSALDLEFQGMSEERYNDL